MRTTHIYIAVALLSFLLYANTLTHEYVWDDQLVITENEYTLKGTEGIKDIWTKYTYLSERKIYRPIPQTIHALEWQYFPNFPIIGHLTSIIFYILCVISTLILVKTFFPNTNNWLIFYIGLMFSLLPVHTEVVANIKSLDEILSALFCIWSLIVIKKISLKNICLFIVFYAFALLSKVSAITTLPFIALIMLLSFNINFSKYYLKWKPYVNYNLLIIISLILVAAYFNKINASKITVYYPLFLALFFTLFIKNKIIKLSFYFLITLGLSYYGRWEYSLIALIIMFGEDLKSKEINKKLWGVITLIFMLITIFLDFNTISTSIGIVLLLIAYYFYVNSLYKNQIKYGLYLLLVIVVFSKLFELPDLHFRLVYIILLSILIFNKNASISLLKKSLLLLIFIPILELSLKGNNYANLLKNKNISIVDIEKDIKGEKIEPYHNILVLSNSKAQKAATICRIQLIYLQKLIFPNQLIHQYGSWQIKFATWKDWDVYLSILIHILLLIGAIYFYKKKHYLVMWGIAWYFVTISIYTNIIRLMPDTLAERFLFLPSIGFSVAFSVALFYFINSFIKNDGKTYKTMAVLLAPLFIYYAYKTIGRNKDWKNNYTLAANTLPFAQNNATINAQYALEVSNLIKYGLVENKDSAQALVIKHYEKAIDIFPDFYGPQSDLATHYILQADPTKAFPYLLQASKLKPNEWTHQYYLGLIFYERKKYNEAIERFNVMQKNKFLLEKTLNNSELLESYEYEARCLHNLGKDSLAVIELEKAIDIFNQESTYILLANLYRTIGKTQLAIEVFEKLLTKNPNNPELINTIQFLKAGKIY